jgi:hypothetical protein
MLRDWTLDLGGLVSYLYRRNDSRYPGLMPRDWTLSSQRLIPPPY